MKVALQLVANGCGYVECEKGIEIPYQVPTEPDFFILFLNFIVKAKSKNLAVNGSVTYERLQPLFALHIGVVVHCALYIINKGFNN